MLKYILRRIIIFIPTLVAISLITFIISLNAPGDPVEQMLNLNQGGEGQLADKLATEKAYKELSHKLGLDRPLFYFSIKSLASCDTLYKIQDKRHKKNLERFLNQYGNWEYISKYYQNIRELETELFKLKKESVIVKEDVPTQYLISAHSLITIRYLANELFIVYKDSRIKSILGELEGMFNFSLATSDLSMQSIEQRKGIEMLFVSASNLNNLNNLINKTKESYENIIKHDVQWTKYIPTISFHGLNNQYHKWVSGFIRGDFGTSYQDMRPVSSVLWDALRWTLILSFLSIIFTYIISIPIGVQSAMAKGGIQDNVITTFLFILYSLPNFWIATLLIMFLGGGDYLGWFPAYGIGYLPASAPLFDRFADTSYHLVLPLVCLIYPTFAFLSRQMRGGMLNVLNQDYIRTAWAKGLSKKKVVWKHSFRNALLPIITLFANVFPYAIAGSVVLEVIFSIPGMGKLVFEAIFARNYPIVFTVVMFASILTLVGYLVADILYAIVDPRISYSGKNK